MRVLICGDRNWTNYQFIKYSILIIHQLLEPIDGLHIPEVDGLTIFKDLNAEIRRLRELLHSIPRSIGITEKDING